MGKAGIAASLAVLASMFVATPAASGAVPQRFSHPVTLGRQLTDSHVIRAEDVSGDGIPDLISTGNLEANAQIVKEPVGDTQDVAVWLGKGDGSFRARSAYRTAEGYDVVVKDIDGDGKPDLIAAGAAPHGPITILVNDGGGRFRRDRVVRSGARALDVAAEDVNRDGLIDLVVAGSSPRDIGVLVRAPDGSFAAPTRFAALGEAAAGAIAVDDLNDDGDVDLAVAGNDRVAVLLGNGDGTFRPVSSPLRSPPAADLHVADVNRDGKHDLVLANNAFEARNRTVAAFLGNGDGTFAPSAQSPSVGWTFGFAVADVDGDTNPDVAAGGVLLSGHGDGTFAQSQPLPTNFDRNVSVTSAVADFNLDGRPDVAVGWGVAFGEAWSVGVFLNWTGLPAPPCIVPPVDHPSFFQGIPRPRLVRAKRLLRSNGCAVGRVRSRPSRRVRKGRILDQHPEAGSVLPSHSRVDLIVSRGAGGRSRPPGG
jgi:hypothetical protein